MVYFVIAFSDYSLVSCPISVYLEYISDIIDILALMNFGGSSVDIRGDFGCREDNGSKWA